jgi:hypothetical protein
MQAMIIFAMFGMLLAGVGQIVSGASETTQKFNLILQEQTTEYFNNIKTIIADDIIQNTMALAERTSCGTDIYASTRIEPYVCLPQIAQTAVWPGSDNGRNDPWRTPITGVVKHARMPLYAGTGNAFEIPVSAFAFVSAGPDRQLGATLLNQINTLQSAANTAATLRAVQAIQSTHTDTHGADDIVVTFSTLPALNRRWDKVSQAFENIAQMSLRNYNSIFLNFQNELDSFYYSNVNNFITSGGVSLSPNALSLWRSGAPLPPDMIRPDFNPGMFDNNVNGADARAALGVDEDFALIENLSSLDIAATKSNFATFDQINLSLSNNGSPWGNNLGQLNYSRSYTTN